MPKTQARSAANISLILFPSSHLQKDPYYSLQNNCMWVWLTAESWQDCSMIFSDDLQLQNQLISLVADEEYYQTASLVAESEPLWTTKRKWCVLVAGEPLCRGQRPSPADQTCPLERFASCWGLAFITSLRGDQCLIQPSGSTVIPHKHQ